MEPEAYFYSTLPQILQEIHRTVGAEIFIIESLFLYVAHWPCFHDFMYSLLFVFISFCLCVYVMYVHCVHMLKHGTGAWDFM
jgi:hypothetical protein